MSPEFDSLSHTNTNGTPRHKAGVLNSPFIRFTIFFKPTTGETTKTQALSLVLYLINPDPIISSRFLAKGSFFKLKVIQNLGL
jgi:hypothetical protein